MRNRLTIRPQDRGQTALIRRSNSPVLSRGRRDLSRQRQYLLGSHNDAYRFGPGRLQAKLAIGAANDRYEREADRLAEQVMRMQDPGANTFGSPGNQGGPRELQRKCLCGGSGSGECAKCRPESEALLQRCATQEAEPLSVPAVVNDVLRSPGHPLDQATRSFMEPRFGQDFSRVRIHTDSRAAQSARELNALAYTVGPDVVFGAGQYAPTTEAGRRLLAHELAHTAQQGTTQPLRSSPRANDQPQILAMPSSSFYVARQCDPAWAGLDWKQRVTNATKMAAGANRNQCMADMIQEALGGLVTVNESTNTSRTVGAAVAAGQYVELGSPTQINFDNQLNNKTKNNLFGDTSFRLPAGGGAIMVYLVLGPKALNTVGPEFTRMAYQHEQAHADAFILQSVIIGGKPHRATPGEELAIYTLNFTSYFTDIWTINNMTPCGYSLADEFPELFSTFRAATTAEQNSAFADITVFFTLWVATIPCNLMKFSIWLQSWLNKLGATDPLISRLNGLPGTPLTRGTNPRTFLTCPTPCP